MPNETKPTLIFFDTETTGFVKAGAASLDSQPKIVEFAAIKTDEELNVLEEIEFMCNPGYSMPADATKANGITDEMLKDKLPFHTYYQQLVDFFLGSGKLIAHNVNFDVDLLRFELMRMGKLLRFPWPYKHICTVERSMYIEGKRMNLGKLYKLATGKDIEGAHRAMNDVKALVECYRFLRTEDNKIREAKGQ